MFMLLGGNEKKTRKEAARDESLERVKELFGAGRFPVVTTQVFEGRPIAKVLGLVCCRGFDSEEAFFGMAALALKKARRASSGIRKTWLSTPTAANISPVSARR